MTLQSMVEKELFKIPENWIWALSSGVFDSVRDGTHDTPKYCNQGVPLVTSKNLIGDRINFENTKLISFEDYHEIEKRSAVSSGDILIAMIGTIGSPVVVNKTRDFSIKNVGLFKKPKEPFNSWYYKYWLQSAAFTRWLNSRLKGTTQKFAPLILLRNLPIPVAPTNEQHRIVAKIEELFSEIDKGVESLKTAKAQLQVYRQALLKHAFEGKLTAQWRSNNPDKVLPAAELLRSIEQSREERYQQQLIDWQTAVEKWEFNGKEGKKPSKPSKPSVIKPLDSHELEILSQLPQGWAWFLLGDVSDISGGLTKNSKKNEMHTTRPYLRVANVYANKLKLDEVHEIGVSESEINRVLLIKDDLLIVEGNGSIEHVGRVAKWDGSIMGCVHQNHLIKARVYKRVVNPDFLLHFLLSKVGRDSIMREASSTSGLHTLSLFKVGNLKVPMCSFDEAFEIVRLLEEKLSFIENAATSVDLEIQRSSSLKQSILKKAFSGQLVPQDPTDEPASELLKRIQAEKADRETKTKRKSTKQVTSITH